MGLAGAMCLVKRWLHIADFSAVLKDAWPELRADDSAGLQRLARLVKQRLR